MPVPEVHELLTIDERPGMVLDRIDGGPMLSTMLVRPWRLLPLVRRFGEIQADIHTVHANDGLETVHAQVTDAIQSLRPEGADLGAFAAREIEQLPAGDSLLHGD